MIAPTENPAFSQIRNLLSTSDDAPYSSSGGDAAPLLPSARENAGEEQSSMDLNNSNNRLAVWKTSAVFCTMLQNAWRFCRLLVPSFISSRREDEPRKLHHTSWLDGMRGLACLFVFVFHFSWPYHDSVYYGYGVRVIEGVEDLGWNVVENRWFVQLPIIRLFYSGSAMVSIFFVVSGYALAYKPIGLLRQRKWTPFFKSLSSATFRRPIRLLGPMFVSTFVSMLLAYFGVFDLSEDFARGPLITQLPTHPLHMNFLKQFWDWVGYTVPHADFVSPCPLIELNLYGPQTWTIPVEVKGSFMVFLLLIGLCRLKPVFRFLILSVISWHCLKAALWETVCFIWGTLLAEWDHIRQDRAHAELLGIRFRSKASRKWTTLKWGFVFFISLFLLSSPERETYKTPGYELIDGLNIMTANPTQRFRLIHVLGAFLICLSVGSCPDLQRIFTNRIVQYLGRISFALYLMHQCVIDSIGYPIVEFLWGKIGYDTIFKYELSLCLAFLFIFPVIIWSSDVFWRLVDVPFVALSRRVEEKLSVAYE